MIVFDTNLAFNNATTQYTSFNYNSMVKFGNQFLCAGENGLFKLSGTTKMFQESKNSDEVVECYFEPLTLDFGISSQKRLRAVYIGYEADGELTLKISTELCFEESYIIPASSENRYARKVGINRSLKGRYWTFQIYGSDVNYTIDTIQVLPIIRGHGFDKN